MISNFYYKNRRIVGYKSLDELMSKITQNTKDIEVDVRKVVKLKHVKGYTIMSQKLKFRNGESYYKIFLAMKGGNLIYEKYPFDATKPRYIKQMIEELNKKMAELKMSVEKSREKTLPKPVIYEKLENSMIYARVEV